MPWNINLLLHCDLIPELVSTAGRPIVLLTQRYCLKAMICGWLQWPRQQSLAAKLPISPRSFFQHTWKVSGPAADRQCCSECDVDQHLRKLRLSYHWMDWTASKTKDMWYHVALMLISHSNSICSIFPHPLPRPQYLQEPLMSLKV